MEIKLFINSGNKNYEVSALATDSITLTTQRSGSPAKLEFKIARDVVTSGESVKFHEGDNVQLLADGVGIFFGYVFKKTRTKEQIISVTAYDQTIYFKKNKRTYSYEGITASSVIQMIANDFLLNVGELEDTGYLLPARIEDNQVLWDILLNALDITTINTGKLFIFYDDFGSLTLKSIDKMMLPLVLVSDSTTLLDFNFQSDIDTDTYNEVKLYRDIEKNRETFVAKDSLNQLKWGILCYTEQVSEHYSEAKVIELTELLLKQKNRVYKTLSVEDVGDIRVRAGCSLQVKIKDVGEKIDGVLVVNSCTHTFKNNEHTMKLELEGLEGLEQRAH